MSPTKFRWSTHLTSLLSLSTMAIASAPDCRPVKYDYRDVSKDAAAVPDEVIVQFSNQEGLHAPLQFHSLSRRYCLNGTGDCIYSFAGSTACKGRNPDEVVRALNQNVEACGGDDHRSEPVHSPIRRILVNSLIRANSNSIFDPWKQAEYETKNVDLELSRNTQLRDLGAVSAWRYVKPNPDVITAVFEDSGVYTKHPDFQNDIQALNYSQLVAGLKIACRDENCTPDESSGDPHGTFMAGIIAAARNGDGSVGVAWNTRVMPVSAVGDSVTNDAIFARALECALANKARIINASFQSGGPMPETAAMLDRLLFVDKRDFLLIAAAGNAWGDLNSTDHFPAELSSPRTHQPFPNILVVMPHENDGSFPNTTYGKGIVSIAAPGLAFSTTPCDANGQACYGSAITASSSNATAFVSGAAALLWSEYPDWNFADVKWRLLENADLERRLSQFSDPPRKLNLDAIMHPITLRYADEHREVRIGRAGVSINYLSAFPPWMCVRTDSYIARKRADGSFEKVTDGDLSVGDSIEARADCEDQTGALHMASSVPYVAIKKTPD